MISPIRCDACGRKGVYRGQYYVPERGGVHEATRCRYCKYTVVMDPAAPLSFAWVVEQELIAARLAHGPIASLHEAVGVIREEYLEFEQEAFRKHREPDRILAELVQLAAMCRRAVEDLNLLKGQP